MIHLTIEIVLILILLVNVKSSIMISILKVSQKHLEIYISMTRILIGMFDKIDFLRENTYFTILEIGLIKIQKLRFHIMKLMILFKCKDCFIHLKFISFQVLLYILAEIKHHKLIIVLLQMILIDYMQVRFRIQKNIKLYIFERWKTFLLLQEISFNKLCFWKISRFK